MEDEWRPATKNATRSPRRGVGSVEPAAQPRVSPSRWCSGRRRPVCGPLPADLILKRSKRMVASIDQRARLVKGLARRWNSGRVKPCAMNRRQQTKRLTAGMSCAAAMLWLLWHFCGATIYETSLAVTFIHFCQSPEVYSARRILSSPFARRNRASAYAAEHSDPCRPRPRRASRLPTFC
jgi:hypothetical protein